MMKRRTFMKTGLAALAGAGLTVGAHAAAKSKIAGIGMCDWNLGNACDPELIALARDAHLDGIQVSVGTDPERLPLRDRAVQRRYSDLGKKHGIRFHSVAAGGILNTIPLASEPQSAVYVIDAIEAAQALGAKNVLVAFFGNGDLRLRDPEKKCFETKKNGFSTYALNEQAVRRVVEALRQIAPRAERAGVMLGLENTLTAEQNLHIIDQVHSPALQVYYDVGNSTGHGYDVFSELRLLGRERICEVHLKDWKTPLLGSEGCAVDMPAVAIVLQEIGYDKWLVLETSGRKNQFLPDTRANVAYVRKTFGLM